MNLVFTYSEAGGHPLNEDAYEVRPHPSDESCSLCALADGQGGRAGGGEAARLACRLALKEADSMSVKSLASTSTWVSLLRPADEAVRDDPAAGFTTLIGLAVSGGRIVGASSGDSAVWLVGTDGRLVDLTARQVKNPPVGSGGAVFVPFTADLPATSVVLVMSDGVWKYVGRDRIQTLAGTLRGQTLLESLQQQARLPGSGKFQDDFTVIVFQGRDGGEA
jgi:serine/threonine protein phosphatase PrpC